jgi:hypothetical protein
LACLSFLACSIAASSSSRLASSASFMAWYIKMSLVVVVLVLMSVEVILVMIVVVIVVTVPPFLWLGQPYPLSYDE